MTNFNEEHSNPIEIMGFEADMTGLYGGEGTVSHEGDEGRISYQHVLAIEQGIRQDLAPYIQAKEVDSVIEAGWKFTVHEAEPPENLMRQYDTGLQAGAIALANGTLKGRMVSGLLTVTRTLSDGWYDGDRRVNFAESTLKDKAIAVKGLAFAVAVIEGNIPPNDLGFRYDQSAGSMQKVEFASKNIHRTQELARSNPEMFGDPAVTEAVINGVVDRVEIQRPTFMGSPVGKAFPHLNLLLH